MTPLLPKEHGAYAQLAFPLLTGMALAVPSLSTLALGGAAVAFFLANESAAILLGARGVRLKDQEGPRARVQGSVLLVAGAVLGAVGLVAGWPEIWPEVLLPAVTGTLLFLMVLIGRQKTLVGEFLVITAFATLILPMAAASGVDPTRAALTATVWWLSFGLGTLEVRAIKARHKEIERVRWTRWASPLASGSVLAGAVFMALGQGGFPGLAGPGAALIPPLASGLGEGWPDWPKRAITLVGKPRRKGSLPSYQGHLRAR
ncbi:MAG: YwiC-like family protein [Gemmatimonadota bacterium]